MTSRLSARTSVVPDASVIEFEMWAFVTGSATISWVGACQEQVVLQFPYPTTSDGMKRRVATSFDPSWVRFELRPFQEAARDVTTSIHVDVVNWQEGDGVHSIDITVSFTDPSFALPPLHIQGTFCDWPFYLC